VLVYGLLLLWAQTGHFVSLEDSVKDSPYFLGFLLTLVALLKALAAMAAKLTVAQGTSTQSSILLKAAGAAILPTVAGLFMRQALLSRDPAEDARQAIFHSLADELRKHTVAFHTAQRQLIRLIEEFGSTRREQLDSEGRALKAYVSNLEEGVSRLTELGRTLENDTKTVHDGIIESARSLKGQLDGSTKAAAEAAARLSATASVFDASIGVLRTGTADLGSGLTAANEHLRTLHDSIKNTSTALVESARQLGGMASSAREVSEGLGQLPKDLGVIPQRALAAVDDAASAGVRAQAAIAAQIATIGRDLAEVDQIFEGLVRLLTERLRQTAERPS